MRTPTGRLQRSGLLLCVGLLAVAGSACSSDPDQPATLPTDTSTPATTTASPTPATVEDEVESAVRAYYAELTRAAQTNDTRKLRTMTTRGCPCFRPVRVIDRDAQRGISTPDARWTVDTVRVRDTAENSAEAEVRYRVSAYDVLNRTGRRVGHIDAQRSHLSLSLVKGADGWIIGNVFNLEG
jgi:hypothetical protein